MVSHNQVISVENLVAFYRERVRVAEDLAWNA